MATENSYCWVCGSAGLVLAKASNVVAPLTSDSFSITDSHYGMTGAIYRCRQCGFLQCPELNEVLSFYERLIDPEYETGRQERSAQARGVLDAARAVQRGGRLLDIGAGSGILVEQALQLGYEAEGIEPSAWLQQTAQRRGLPVHLGTFPHANAGGLYDVITLIDVVEHVADPVDLLRHIAERLSPSGIALIATPDVSSVMARLLGWRWWHFRVAHIGYFSKQTLRLALDRAGLRPVFFRRPGWFFPADYLWARVNRYLPRILRLAPPEFVKRIVVPVNLRDSWLVGCRKLEVNQDAQGTEVPGASRGTEKEQDAQCQSVKSWPQPLTCKGL